MDKLKDFTVFSAYLGVFRVGCINGANTAQTTLWHILIINPNPVPFDFFKTAKYQGCLEKPFPHIFLDGNPVRKKESQNKDQ